MTDQTPPIFDVHLEFDENALQRRLQENSKEIVLLKCTVKSNGKVVYEYSVDAAAVTQSRLEACESDECLSERTFYYLNGLLNALSKLFLTRKRLNILAVRLHTKSKFLQYNAQENRVYRWKKTGFKRADGTPVRYRSLWNEFYAWCTGTLRFQYLEVVDNASQ